MARLLPADDVTLELRAEESVLNITSGSAEYRLRTYSVEDFPRLPDPQSAGLSAVDSEPLLETVARVGRAASRDESRPVLTGILVRFEGGKLVMAATDSYRLAVKETVVDGELPEMEVIIPARALEELRRVAGGHEHVELGMLDNHAVFGAGGDRDRCDCARTTRPGCSCNAASRRSPLPAGGGRPAAAAGPVALG
jgi:DNA polymerase-3 subunit beta